MDSKLEKILTSNDLNILESLENKVIEGSFLKADEIINNDKYTKIACSISGGADSDIILDICTKVDHDHKIQYVFCNTGLEYQATKDHIEFLKDKYNIKILELTPKKPIPVAVKECGEPFVSKQVSQYISTLQKHDFDWDYNISYAELNEKYNRVKASSRWWTNSEKEITIRFCIDYNRYLKEFMSSFPPYFKISSRCCDLVKKNPLKDFIKSNSIELNINGIRKAEKGVRNTLPNCYTYNKTLNIDTFRPIFWYKNEDKEEYEKAFNIFHSKCYTEYGLIRTGCVGCPFNKNVIEELSIIEKHEPKLYTACCNIFKNSYEYTKKYKEFITKCKIEEKKNK